MCGLCGDYNGNAADDLKDASGILRNKHFEVGNSWEVYDDSGDGE